LGKMAFSLTLFFTLIATMSAFAAPPDPCAKISDNPAYCIEKLDPLGHDKWRLQVKGAYRSLLGTQVHPYCFKLMKEKAGFSQEGIEKGIEAWLQKSFLAVTDDCRARYPALKPYFFEWISLARRTVITCMKKSSTKTGFNGVNPVVGVGLDIVAEGEASKGIDDIPGALDSQAAAHKTVIVLPWNEMRSAIATAGSASSVDTLIHEILHNTSANNQGTRHKQVENIDVTPENLCSLNAMDDRILFVAGLCSNAKTTMSDADSAFSKMTPAQLAFKRISQCGKKRGCVDLFLSQSLTFTHWVPSRPLSKEAADEACDQIYDQGYCENELFKYESVLAFLESLPKFRKYQDQVEKQLELVTPKTNLEIPGSWMKAFPAERAGLEAISKTDCYQSIFTAAPASDQPLRLKTNLLPTYLNDQQKEADLRFGGPVAAAKLELKQSPACMKQPEHQQQIVTLLNKMASEVTNTKRAILEGLQYTPVRAYPTELAMDDFPPSAAVILGNDLFHDYLNFVKENLPASPSFSCRKAGLTPHQISKDAASLLKALRAIGSESVSCGAK